MTSLLFYAVMQMLMANEGFRAEPYQIQGVWHVGYGYNLEARMPNLDVSASSYCADYKCLLWSKAHAFGQLERDVIHIHRRLKVRYECYASLPLEGKIVMLDLSYNLGIRGALKFKELTLSLCIKDYKQAANDLLDSEYARELPNRANRNAQILREGYDL